jgi:hypothetical protein
VIDGRAGPVGAWRTRYVCDEIYDDEEDGDEYRQALPSLCFARTLGHFSRTLGLVFGE